MHRFRSTLILATSLLAGTGSTSAQIEIGFDGFPFGTVMNTQFPLVTFGSSFGNQVSISGPASNPYLCSGPVGSRSNCTERVDLDFNGPVGNLTFEAISADIEGTTARFILFMEDGDLLNLPFESNGDAVQQIDLSGHRGIERMEILYTTTNPNEGGIGWDTFRFTTNNTAGGTLERAIEIPGLPYSSSFNNSIITGSAPAGDCNSSNARIMQNAMWFRYMHERSGDIVVSVNTYGRFDPTVMVYENNLDGLVARGCDDGRPLARVVATVRRLDEPVYIQVGDYGVAPEGGLFDIDVRELCPADTNGSGTVSPADFNAWVIAFNNQSPACDQNGDGLCNPADFNAWVINFNAGC